jgi:predicted phosphoadenosine phosphosulfate sulfurtransferase
MLKNILKSIRNWWRNKIQDTTKEWEETGEPEPTSPKSNLIILVDLPFWKRVKFLFTNQGSYRLTDFQCRVIRHNFIDYEKD